MKKKRCMGSISFFRCVYLMSILACIPEVGYGKMVFNVMNYGGVVEGNTNLTKLIFAQ